MRDTRDGEAELNKSVEGGPNINFAGSTATACRESCCRLAKKSVLGARGTVPSVVRGTFFELAQRAD